MFIINLNYIVPLEELDAHMAEHVMYLLNTRLKTYLSRQEEKCRVRAVLSLLWQDL